MNKDTFLCFLEFFGRQFFFQKINLFITQLGKIVQAIIYPMVVRFIFSTIQHDDTGVSPVKRGISFISHIIKMVTHHRIPYVVALTKADKLKKSQLAKTQEDFENICRPYGCQKVVLTSGENGYGIPELQAVLNAAVAAENEEAE